MRRIALFTATLATFFYAQASIAQGQDFSKVEIKIDDLGNGLYMLTGAGGNIGVSAGEDGVFIIDDQFAPLSAKIKAAIATVSDKPIRFVINTHWHGDHTGGNENFGKDGAIIVAQDNVYARMSVDQVMPAFNRTVPAAPHVALPVITYTKNMTLHQNGRTVLIRHVKNAHTDGDSLIRFKDANVVHMGDTYFAGRFPFIDSASGGSIDGVIAAVGTALGMVDEQTKIIPGHGPLSNKAELTKYRAMLIEVRDRMHSAIASGRTLDQLLADKPLADLDTPWGGGFISSDRFVRGLYAQMSGDAE